ncbi:protein YLS3-like isoform X1 [Papaver somniferum]|uniref:protein YLS3-like isoform X1 n=1 Tax=Papaver somniferum TaxID=3469 RepID=UPI000E6F9A9A|nr:protein YLS3-like isoform X1 [Papaver somniferum]
MMKIAVFVIIGVVLVGFVKSDVDKDKGECQDQLIKLSTCLSYVGGTSKAPTPSCCTGLGEVLSTTKKCLCLLVKDRDNPALGLHINSTRALGLPRSCNVPANISHCPALLHLAPNSPEAKVFEDFTSSSANTKTNSTGNLPSPTADAGAKDVKKNGGDKSTGSVWVGIKMLSMVMILDVLLFGV